MNPFTSLESAYRTLAARPASWTTPGLGDDLDRIVAVIRGDQADPGVSDRTLRAIIDIGRAEPDAVTVALHALAPALRSRLARAVTLEYQADALCELAFVLLDSDLERPGLAHRLVNRAHSRVWRHARRAHTRGTRNPVTTLPVPPGRLGPLIDHLHGPVHDVADTAAARVDLTRFASAVRTAVTEGALPEAAWTTYRDRRLQRAITGVASPSTGTERVVVHRTGQKLKPYIDSYLSPHAA